MNLYRKIGSLFAFKTIRKEIKAEDHLFERNSKEILKEYRIGLMEYLSSKYVKAMLVLEDKDKYALDSSDKTREEIIEIQIKAAEMILKLCPSSATYKVSRIIANMVKESLCVQELITPKTSKTIFREVNLFKIKLPF